MNNRDIQKANLIIDGIFDDYRKKRKEQYNEGYTDINEDPEYYGITEEEKKLLDCLLKSTKNKKADYRRHAQFMNEYYDNVGLLTLSFSNEKITCSKLESKRHIVADILKECFDDYMGKLEISPNGRLHAHFIVGWNGEVETFETIRQDDNGKKHKNILAKKPDLQNRWYGEKTKDGQPQKYGIYDLVMITKNRTELNKTVNYTLKNLNSMTSYIDKEERTISPVDLVDDELIYEVNHSNIITARNTPYQYWNKARKEQDRYIRRSARVFETSFYEKNKYNGKKVFREWAEENKHTNISAKPGTHIDLFGDEFKLIEIADYK